MDSSFDRVQDQWNKVDIAMESVEEAPFYTEETANNLHSAVNNLIEEIELWRHRHGD